jgi:hypothetical protein
MILWRATHYAISGVGASLLIGVLVFSTSASAASWTLQSTPNSGSEHSNLYDISCAPSVTNPCISVGKQETSGKSTPYAQAWNGSTWTNIAIKSPEGATAGESQSVDCPLVLEGVLGCFAAGSYTSGGVTKSLILSGNSSSGLTGVSETANPEGASETVLKGLACRVGGNCVAVGYSVKSGKKTAFALKYSESKWAIHTMPEPEGATSSELLGVDCPTSTFCMAVGSYSLSAGEPQWAWSATWNGSSWTLRSVTNPSGSLRSVLLDVSCESASSCTGAGAYRNSSSVQVSFIARWNGSSWSYQSSPNPVGSTNTVFQGISCVASSICVSVGDWNNGKSWQPMAQEWNGSAWALDTTPNPSGATETVIEGVSCRTSGCLSSGWYANSEGKRKTLGESR